MSWRIVLSGGGAACLVHVAGESREEAIRAALRKVERDLHVNAPVIRSAERISACGSCI
jgi:hypothetical protein